MWNEKTKQLVADGKLVVIGVVQEQHAERAQLYKQWKQYEFPIAQDAVTGLGLAVVPVAILIDEYGYVQDARPRVNKIEELVAVVSEKPGVTGSIHAKIGAPTLDPERASITSMKRDRSNENQPESDIVIADTYLQKQTIDSTKKAIEHYDLAMAVLKQRNKPRKGMVGAIHFRLGVAYRSLYDLSKPADQDPVWFTKAATSWTNALNENPNQYIWRRRIQQYGPRQMKPYPFYDWVEKAQQEIAARGETPIELTVALSKAEIAQPNRKFTSETTSENPDPEGKITRDDEEIVSLHSTVVPHKVTPGKTARVHLRFSTNQGHWNNEAEPMVVWIEKSEAGKVSNAMLTHPNGDGASSDEVRNLEFEFQTNADLTGETSLKAYALYYVCTDDDGQCLYRRQDLSIPIQIEPKSK